MTAAEVKRPFKVLGIQQIAIGGPDKKRLQTLWVDMLGLEVTGTFQSEKENVDEDICAMGSGPFKVEVDLMQPLDPATGALKWAFDTREPIRSSRSAPTPPASRSARSRRRRARSVMRIRISPACASRNRKSCWPARRPGKKCRSTLL